MMVLFPDANPFHFLRYLAATLWITFLYPLAGRKAGLFS